MQRTLNRDIDRRAFVVGTAAAAVGTGLGIATAQADEAAGTPQVDPDAVQSVQDYDIVICGAGAAGLAAAVRAAQQGAKTVCLEKCSMPYAPGTNYGFVNVPEFLEAGCEYYDERGYIESLLRNMDAMGHQLLYKNFVYANPEVGAWMLQMARDTGHTYEINTLLCSVAFDDEYAMMTEALEAASGELVCSMAARQLVVEDGVVVGVVAEDVETGEYVRYNAAKGVVLATGGYSGNPDLIRKYIPWVDPDALEQYAINAFEGGEDGDAIAMAEAIGLPIGPAPHMPEIHFVHGSVPVAGDLYVDGLGQRIPDNDLGVIDEYRAQHVMRCAGHSTWRVMDSKPGWRPFIPPGLPPEMQPDYDAPMEDYATLDDAAAALGFDPDIFKATVEAWNAMIEAGVDDVYDTDLSESMAIDTPPYHVRECKPCNLAMIGGVIIDPYARVLRDDFRPMPGLWAAGNCCSGFFGTNYPKDAKFGDNRAFCAVTGYMAVDGILGRSE